MPVAKSTVHPDYANVTHPSYNVVQGDFNALAPVQKKMNAEQLGTKYAAGLAAGRKSDIIFARQKGFNVN